MVTKEQVDELVRVSTDLATLRERKRVMEIIEHWTDWDTAQLELVVMANALLEEINIGMDD